MTGGSAPMTEFEKLQARLHADMADLQATQEAKMYEERRKAERSLREREAAAVRREAADAARKREEAEEELLFEAAMRAAEQLRRDLEASRLVDEKKASQQPSPVPPRQPQPYSSAARPPPPRGPPPTGPPPFRRSAPNPPRAQPAQRTPMDAFDDVRVRKLWDEHEVAWERLEEAYKAGTAQGQPAPPVPWPPHDDGVLASLRRRHAALGLKAAFRKASLRWHPDKVATRFGASAAPRAQHVFQAVLASYQAAAAAEGM